MSDDEDEVRYTKRTKVLHYGSLEEKERERLTAGAGDSLAGEAIKAGILAGNINISEGKSHRLSQQGVWVPFWTPKLLKRTPQDTQIC